jgi:hypothetical protein
MAIPSSGQVSASDINIELGRSATAEKSLNQARSGEYSAINQANEDKPSSSGQVAYSDWRGYDHDKVALSIIPISSTTTSKSACTAKIVQNGYFDNGINVNSTGFLDSAGSVKLADGFYNTNQSVAIEIKDGKIIKIAGCK